MITKFLKRRIELTLRTMFKKGRSDIAMGLSLLNAHIIGDVSRSSFYSIQSLLSILAKVQPGGEESTSLIIGRTRALRQRYRGIEIFGSETEARAKEQERQLRAQSNLFSDSPTDKLHVAGSTGHSYVNTNKMAPRSSILWRVRLRDTYNNEYHSQVGGVLIACPSGRENALLPTLKDSFPVLINEFSINTGFPRGRILGLIELHRSENKPFTLQEFGLDASQTKLIDDMNRLCFGLNIEAIAANLNYRDPDLENGFNANLPMASFQPRSITLAKKEGWTLAASALAPVTPAELDSLNERYNRRWLIDNKREDRRLLNLLSEPPMGFCFFTSHYMGEICSAYGIAQDGVDSQKNATQDELDEYGAHHAITHSRPF